MNINPINIMAFKGNYLADKSVEKILSQDSKKMLDNLADVAGIDTIATVKRDNIYIPGGRDMYITSATLYTPHKINHGEDILILSKGATNKEVSEKIFESAQNAVGKLYGQMAVDKTIKELYA